MITILKDILTVDAKNLIPATIEESADSIAKLAPVLQSNWLGALLTIALMVTMTACAGSLLIVWRSPGLDINQLALQKHA